MIKKYFFATSLVSLCFSFQLFATDVENDNDVVSPRFRDIWSVISSKLTEEKDIVQLSRVCKLTHTGIESTVAWEGVAQKYQVKPQQIRRYLELLSKYKEQEEIELGILGVVSKFFNLEQSYIEKFRYTKIEAALNQNQIYAGLYGFKKPVYYMKVTDYVRLEVENEEMSARKYIIRVTPLEPLFVLEPKDIEKFFIKLEDEK